MRERGTRLFEQSLSCCFNPRLLNLAPPLDVKTYTRTADPLATLEDSLHGCLSEALVRLGTRLNAVMAASDFLSVPATLPTRMARRHAPGFGLAVSPVPLDLPMSAVSMVWSAQLNHDPGLVWLRGQIMRVLAQHRT